MNDEEARQGLTADTTDLSLQSIGRDGESLPDMLAAALRTARRGYRVFPCIPGTKKPYTTNGFKDATRDEGLIEGWWRQWPKALIATPDTCTVDIEAPKPRKNGGRDGPNGWIAWERLVAEHGVPDAPTTKTGLYNGIRGGQLHFAPRDDVKTGGFAPGIELRAHGAYVLLPPSRHSSGVSYEGELPPLDELPQLSEWIVDLRRGRKREKGNEAEPGPAERLPVVIRDGEWHRSMVSAAGTMRRRGFSEEAATVALIAQNATYEGTPPPDSDDEIADLVADVFDRYEAVEVIPVSREKRCSSRALKDVLAAVRRYLDVTEGEEDFIIGALATAVSKVLVEEEPLWMILVGASGGGKTEAIKLLAGVAEGRVDELTRAGLLSWAPGKKAKPVGLLTRIPRSSLVTISDFSTVVTMGDREARARMFGMLRVVYDGRVYRSIGGQPAAEGDELVWEGHLTLLAAGTPVVDTHTSFEGALGERWLMLRLAESDTGRARTRARFAVRREDASARREEAQEAARGLLLAARERIPARLQRQSEERLVDVAIFVALARTGVVYEGQGKYRVITGIPTPEEPTRLAGQLTRLARCAIALGLDESEALRLAVTAAVDSVPLARMRALRAVADHAIGTATVEDVRRALGRANWYVAKWELDALETIGLVVAESAEINGVEQPTYRLFEPYRRLYTNVAFSHISLSKKSVGRRGAAYDSVEGQTRMTDGVSDCGEPE